MRARRLKGPRVEVPESSEGATSRWLMPPQLCLRSGSRAALGFFTPAHACDQVMMWQQCCPLFMRAWGAHNPSQGLRASCTELMQ